MTDIVERLRGMNIYMDGKWEYPPLCSEAADEIERLRHDAAVQEKITDVKIQKYNQLIAVLEKIADLHRGPGPALARSALDTMKVLSE